MIVPARRSAPRAQNYRRGVWAGMGATLQMPPDPVWQDPGYPPSPAIVARNTAANDAYQVARAGAMAQYMLDQCHENAQNALPGAQRDAALARCSAQYSDAGAYAASSADTPVIWYTPTAAASAAPVANGGKLTFTTSRGGTALQVGDTWRVAIAGASPNSPVTVSGSMPGSSFSGSSMGSTDASGNFSKSGTVDTSTVGAWQEVWSVGGAPSGSISFTVAPAVTPGGQTIIQSSGAQSTATSGTSVSLPTIGGFDLSTVPWWGWAGAAAAALFMMKGGH